MCGQGWRVVVGGGSQRREVDPDVFLQGHRAPAAVEAAALSGRIRMQQSVAVGNKTCGERGRREEGVRGEVNDMGLGRK